MLPTLSVFYPLAQLLYSIALMLKYTLLPKVSLEQMCI